MSNKITDFSAPYLLSRSTGKLINVEGVVLSPDDSDLWIHPIINWDLYENFINDILYTMTNDFYPALEWIYKNYNGANKEAVQDALRRFVANYTYYTGYYSGWDAEKWKLLGDYVWFRKKQSFGDNTKAKKYLYSGFKQNNLNDAKAVESKLIDELIIVQRACWDEYCAVRADDPYETARAKSKTAHDLYFRIAPENTFNWFDLIWQVVEENRNTAKSVTVERGADPAAQDGEIIITNGKSLDHMPVEEFLTLSGKPVIEELTEEVNMDVKELSLEAKKFLAKGNMDWLPELAAIEKNGLKVVSSESVVKSKGLADFLDDSSAIGDIELDSNLPKEEPWLSPYSDEQRGWRDDDEDTTDWEYNWDQSDFGLPIETKDIYYAWHDTDENLLSLYLTLIFKGSRYRQYDFSYGQDYDDIGPIAGTGGKEEYEDVYADVEIRLNFDVSKETYKANDWPWVSIDIINQDPTVELRENKDNGANMKMIKKPITEKDNTGMTILESFDKLDALYEDMKADTYYDGTLLAIEENTDEVVTHKLYGTEEEIKDYLDDLAKNYIFSTIEIYPENSTHDEEDLVFWATNRGNAANTKMKIFTNMLFDPRAEFIKLRCLPTSLAPIGRAVNEKCGKAKKSHAMKEAVSPTERLAVEFSAYDGDYYYDDDDNMDTDNTYMMEGTLAEIVAKLNAVQQEGFDVYSVDIQPNLKAFYSKDYMQSALFFAEDIDHTDVEFEKENGYYPQLDTPTILVNKIFTKKEPFMELMIDQTGTIEKKNN